MAEPLEPVIDLEAVDDEAQEVAARAARRGFLPIQTNWFDRLFIAIYIAVALILLWMRFLEPAGVSIYLCYVLVLVLGAVIIRKG